VTTVEDLAPRISRAVTIDDKHVSFVVAGKNYMLVGQQRSVFGYFCNGSEELATRVSFESGRS
jgi:hypothetical protein